ncbi:hypothetical protein IFM89_023528 [Coptis chinensis]|uniref:Uncharacterized protein n=1 Tax=Coptis chinensis TaxID=261450 RepID=A0A835LWC6_9MAGN|nr:hypothetical protein IFM89_023528 [Coptis chinensis]
MKNSFSIQSQSNCLADLCGALHCDLVMDSKLRKAKCNPAAAARNHHLCESLADNCFPVNAGPPAGRLHELFLRQFCDAHTCTGKRKPFSRGGKESMEICGGAMCRPGKEKEASKISSVLQIETSQNPLNWYSTPT